MNVSMCVCVSRLFTNNFTFGSFARRCVHEKLLAKWNAEWEKNAKYCLIRLTFAYKLRYPDIDFHSDEENKLKLRRNVLKTERSKSQESLESICALLTATTRFKPNRKNEWTNQNHWYYCQTIIFHLAKIERCVFFSLSLYLSLSLSLGSSTR